MAINLIIYDFVDSKDGYLLPKCAKICELAFCLRVVLRVLCIKILIDSCVFEGLLFQMMNMSASMHEIAPRKVITILCEDLCKSSRKRFTLVVSLVVKRYTDGHNVCGLRSKQKESYSVHSLVLSISPDEPLVMTEIQDFANNYFIRIEIGSMENSLMSGILFYGNSKK